MRIWIDLANSPHVPFFRALIDRFVKLDHQVAVTARDFAETVSLANLADLSPEVIGNHGGGKLSGKAGNLVGRAWALSRWGRPQRFDLAVSHNSYSQIVAARLLGLKAVTLMDYEYQPANHLAFRFSEKIIVPASFPEERLQRYGASPRKVFRYQGTKEDVYLADFNANPAFQKELSQLGVGPDTVLVLMRPPAQEALYHRFQNELFEEALNKLLSTPGVQVVLLPRNQAQRAQFSARRSPTLIVPSAPLNGPDLIAASDLVISAGGTINREAAALGVPVASIYAGKWAAVDEELVRQGRLQRISRLEHLAELRVQKKANINPRRSVDVIDQVVNLILA
jgi:uncharacterized protein